MPLLRKDAFSAVMLASPALPVTDEQKSYIRAILDVACSDTRFAEKAYVAISRVLTGGITVEPEITSLNPGSATVGDADFTLHVVGKGFTPTSVIVFNGGEEPTTFISSTELTTGVSMATVSGASTVPVNVLNDGVLMSAAMSFVFEDAGTPLSARKITRAEGPAHPTVNPNPTEKKHAN